MEVERHRGLIRFGLIYLTVTTGWLAVWILIAPRGFYDTFPGGGVHWVSALPPYNEHLERDFGATSLALAVLAGLAALWMDRRVIQAATSRLIDAACSSRGYRISSTT